MLCFDLGFLQRAVFAVLGGGFSLLHFEEHFFFHELSSGHLVDDERFPLLEFVSGDEAIVENVLQRAKLIHERYGVRIEGWKRWAGEIGEGERLKTTRASGVVVYVAFVERK